MKNRLFENAVALGTIQAVNYVVPFIVLVHLARSLGAEFYGVLAFSQGIVALSLVIIDFGYELSATNKISKYRNNKKYIAELIGAIFLIKIIIFFICAAMIVLYSFLTEKYIGFRAVFFVSLLPLVAQAFIPVWFFQGVEKMKLIALYTVAAKIMFSVSAVVLIEMPSDYIFVHVLNGFWQFVALLFSIYLIYKLDYYILLPRLKMAAYCFKFTRHFFASRLAVASYMNGAIIVLGLFAQPAVIAVYSMAEQLYKAMQSAISPVAAAAYPYMSKEKNINLMFKIIIICIALSFLGACLGYFVAPALISLVFDQSWLQSIPVLNVFFVAIVVHAAAVVTGYPLAATVGRLDVANSSVITGASIYFFFLAIMFYFDLLSSISLALVMVLSEFGVLVHRVCVLLPVAINQNKINQKREIIL